MACSTRDDEMLCGVIQGGKVVGTRAVHVKEFAGQKTLGGGSQRMRLALWLDLGLSHGARAADELLDVTRVRPTCEIGDRSV